SMSDPWNAPGSWRVLLASLGRSDSAMQLRLKALPALARWGVGFLRSSSVEKYQRNTLSNLRLALHSMQVLRSLRDEARIEYGLSTHGTLRLFRNEVAMEHAAMAAERLVARGVPCKRLSTIELVALEPTLAAIAGELKGAIHYPADESGDAHRFC